MIDRDAPRSLRSRAAADPAAKDPGSARASLRSVGKRAPLCARSLTTTCASVSRPVRRRRALVTADLFADAEAKPGRRIADTPYADQVAHILHCIDTEHSQLLAQAGLDASITPSPRRRDCPWTSTIASTLTRASAGPRRGCPQARRLGLPARRVLRLRVHWSRFLRLCRHRPFWLSAGRHRLPHRPRAALSG